MHWQPEYGKCIIASGIGIQQDFCFIGAANSAMGNMHIPINRHSFALSVSGPLGPVSDESMQFYQLTISEITGPYLVV